MNGLTGLIPEECAHHATADEAVPLLASGRSAPLTGLLEGAARTGSAKLAAVGRYTCDPYIAYTVSCLPRMVISLE